MIPEYPKLIALIENDVTNITITQQEISVKCIPPSLTICGFPFWTAGTLGKLLQTEIAGGKNTHQIQDECWTQKHRGFAFCGGSICRGRDITRWKVFDQSEIFRAIVMILLKLTSQIHPNMIPLARKSCKRNIIRHFQVMLQEQKKARHYVWWCKKDVSILPQKCTPPYLLHHSQVAHLMKLS